MGKIYMPDSFVLFLCVLYMQTGKELLDYYSILKIDKNGKEFFYISTES